jgi:hypothetical protein
MARSTEGQIQELVATFTANLLKVVVVRGAAFASFASAFELKGELGANGAGPRKRGRPAKGPASGGKGKRTVGRKRDPRATPTKRLGADIAVKRKPR